MGQLCTKAAFKRWKNGLKFAIGVKLNPQHHAHILSPFINARHSIPHNVYFLRRWTDAANSHQHIPHNAPIESIVNCVWSVACRRPVVLFSEHSQTEAQKYTNPPTMSRFSAAGNWHGLLKYKQRRIVMPYCTETLNAVHFMNLLRLLLPF